MRILLILLIMAVNYTFAFADIYEPMTINITENPVSSLLSQLKPSSLST